MGKRYDKKHRLLKTGESERPDGYYQYRYTDRKGKRHTLTAGTLEELRQREEEIIRDKSDGIRAGEITGLRWQDIDMAEDLIEVNHTLVYYNHAENGCYFSIHTPKTKAGNRTIPMLDEVKQAFLDEKRYQELNGLKCKVTVDGYTDFIFINRFGNLQHQGTLNKALRRIIRDCKDM